MEKASNNQIKLLRKLNRKKYREEERLFFVEGERAVEQVLENAVLKVREVFISSGRIGHYAFKTGSVFLLDEEIFDEVADTGNPQGIMAICEMPDEISVDELAPEKGLVIATDRIQDPGNLGSMIRSAAWFGVQGVIIGKGSVDLFNPKVVRSTAGATGSIPYLTGELNPVLHAFEEIGWKVVLLDGNPGALDIREYTPGKQTIVVVGNEANGIHPDLITESRDRLMIPGGGSGRGESLNAAIALSISLFAIHS